MMRVMIDIHIFLDVLLKREPFFEASRDVLRLCEEKKVQGFLPASSATDLFYIIRKGLQSTDAAYRALGSILDIVKVLTVTHDDVLHAYLRRAADFEDCLLATCAGSNRCGAIVTRNKRDFLDFGIPLMSPEELLESVEGRGQ